MIPAIAAPKHPHAAAASSAQSGSVLLIVVLLLLLATLFIFFALNVGRIEQSTSGNDFRAKLVQELAESGVHQGVEYFDANPGVRADETKWDLCEPDDLTFPCGAVTELGVDPDAGGALPAPQRRARMYRYFGGTGTPFQKSLLPIPVANQITSTGGFNATQHVGAVLCRIKKPASAGDPTDCATTASEASSIWVMTIVSKGTLTGEGSSATVTQTIGSFGIFNMGTGIPPVIASGNVAVGGGLQIVTSPNAAGTSDGSGVPVSVWTRLAMSKLGTPNTCYLEDFLRQGGSSSGPDYFDGIEVCHTCNCPADASLSYAKSGGEACQGMDIVDIDNNEPNDCAIAPNIDIGRSEFPPDLFAFVFGRPAWNDDDQGSGGDTYANLEFNFAETRRVSECKFPHPLTKAEVTAVLPEDTCFLLQLNNIVHIGDGVDDAAQCDALGATSRGIVWVHPQPIQSSGATVAGMAGFDCTTKIRGLDDFGTPSHPVVLIYDGTLTQVHFRLYGLLFVREPNASLTLNAATGGSAELGLNAGATIYGAAIVQGQITSGGGGTSAIVFNEKVLSNLVNDPDLPPSPTSLPGSWTDRVRY